MDLFGEIVCREAVILHHAPNAPLHGAFATGRWIAVAQLLALASEQPDLIHTEVIRKYLYVFNVWL